MNNANPSAASANTGNASQSKQILLKDIRARWGKFSDQELGALKNNDDAVGPAWQHKPRSFTSAA